MKKIAVEEAQLPLVDYAAQLGNEPVILTREGQAFAVLSLIDSERWESFVVANDPEFRAIIEGSRAAYQREGGVPLEQLRRELGLASD